MQLFNQCDTRWGPQLLGSGTGRGTLCKYGCYDSVFAMIANASGHATNPGALNAAFASSKIFTSSGGGTFDLLPDNALDKLYPGDYKSTSYAGFRADLIKAAIPTPDTYVLLHIVGYAPIWKMNVGHFVLAWTADGKYIADPQGGAVRPLSAYGGPANVQRTVLVKRLPKPAPVPTPAPVPAPVELYSVVMGEAVVANRLTLANAKAEALTVAKAHVGLTVKVVSEKDGSVVSTEMVPVPPLPVPPAPLPKPVPPDNTQEDLAGLLQNILVALVLFLRKRFNPDQVQA